MSVHGADVSLGGTKQRAVLALLLINRNRPVAVHSLLDGAWRQDPPPHARTSLHTYVAGIRRLMGTGGVDPAAILVSGKSGYRLNVADAACDIGRFSIELAAGMQAATASRFEQASNRLSAALAQWRGPVLDDLRDFEFAEAFAAALAEDKLLAQTLRAESEIACGRSSSVITDLELLVAQEPHHEPLWAQLITAYYLTERQYDALKAYQRVKTALADDLGIDPGPRLRGLHEQILRQDPLEVKRLARTTAARAVALLKKRSTASQRSAAVALLRDSAGRTYPLQGVATRIGRLPDYDIVLDDAAVSRQHAAIIDTGVSFVITDLRSANGVFLNGDRVRVTATLADGDRIRVSKYEFTFEVGRDE
jgi:DNA-binding SARP family transcriptional activator